MELTRHVARGYQQDIDELAGTLRGMADRCVLQLRAAVDALLQHDAGAAAVVLGQDDAIDEDENRCDELCIRLMAKWAPVGGDLRLVLTVLKVVIDLERIGDLAVNVAKRTIEVSGGSIRDVPEVAALAQRALAELEHAVAALKERDSTAARAIRTEDHEVDQLNRAAFQRFMELAKDDPTQLEPILAWTSICRYLERVGDHAVNISEAVVYLVEGKVVKHRGE